MSEDLRSVLGRWDEAVRAGVGRFDEVAPHVAKYGTVLRAGASPAAVTAAEQRLGVVLPASYREFLLVSDGAWASSLGVSTASSMEGQLLGAERVGWFVDVDPDHALAWADGVGSFDEPEEDAHPGYEPVEVWDFDRMRDALVIGVNFDGMDELLVPRVGIEEWEVWLTYKEGATAYRSFADFLRWHTENAPPPADPARVDEYAADALSGQDPWALTRLAEVDGDRALIVAMEVLDRASPRRLPVRRHQLPLPVEGPGSSPCTAAVPRRVIPRRLHGADASAGGAGVLRRRGHPRTLA